MEQGASAVGKVVKVGGGEAREREPAGGGAGTAGRVGSDRTSITMMPILSVG